LQPRMRKSELLFLLVVWVVSQGQAFPQTGVSPKVTSTDPADRATGVSRFHACIAVTFDTPMSTSYCGIGTTPNWQIGTGTMTCTWSEDRRTMTSCRPAPADNPLAYGGVIQAVLNPSGIPP
jgi:hypothetical protein